VIAWPEGVLDLARRLAVSEASLPAYVYDLGALDAHAARIRAALPRAAQFYYAVKANPDAEVLRVLARHADGFEVSSGGELGHAAAAVPGHPLAFGGPGKTGAELATAIGAGTGRFHVESPHELNLLAAAAAAAGQTVDVLLRVNPPGGSSAGARGLLVMGGGPSPFGMDIVLLDRCAAMIAGLGSLRLRGLHAHLASGLDAGELVAAAGRLLDFGRGWCAGHGVTEPEFNLGGGMAVDYLRPGAVFDWASYGRGLAELVRDGETLRIEPGRAVTAYCGWYLTRVLDVKHSHGEAFAVVAGGTHHLRTPAAKGHDQPFAVIAVDDWAHSWPRPGVSDAAVTIAGQLCTPKDVLARRVMVPRLRVGDLVAFGMAGAYAWNISHQSFLMHPPPVFHYL
jgi:diaminopimelate decarboxylase